MSEKFEVIVIGAGASGLMCAAQAAKRGKKVLVLDNGVRPGRKVLMAGGGRCNFTNRRVLPENYICANPHFVKSALSRFSSRDFIALVESFAIPYHERSHGQLFCDNSAADILDMLLTLCQEAQIRTGIQVTEVKRHADLGIYTIKAGTLKVEAPALVIATGGLSYPAAGATPFGYQVASRFGIPVKPPRPGLVPFTLAPEDKALYQSLSGVSVLARVRCEQAEFQEQLLFTHRGLSGPVILQVSSYWTPGQPIVIDLLPGQNLADLIEAAKKDQPKKQARSMIGDLLPKRLAEVRLSHVSGARTPLGALSRKEIQEIAQALHAWQVKPSGTEGNRTAEVTAGGVDTDAVSSKTFEAKEVPGLYFIGEVLDVTGQLGGYNLQWAWSSGFCAGQWV